MATFTDRGSFTYSAQELAQSILEAIGTPDRTWNEIWLIKNSIVIHDSTQADQPSGYYIMWKERTVQYNNLMNIFTTNCTFLSAFMWDKNHLCHNKVATFFSLQTCVAIFFRESFAAASLGQQMIGLKKKNSQRPLFCVYVCMCVYVFELWVLSKHK